MENKLILEQKMRPTGANMQQKQSGVGVSVPMKIIASCKAIPIF